MIVNGVIVQGHGIASGKAQDSPYPKGSLAMQAEYFKKGGLNLSSHYLGTLNVDITPLKWEPKAADYIFKNVEWTTVIPAEHFSFLKCDLNFEGKWYDALTYYPHPVTKITHFQNPGVMEVITKKIPGLGYGKEVEIKIDTEKITLIK